MNKWIRIPDDKTLQKTADALTTNNIHAQIVENGQEAKKKVLQMIPQNADVMNFTSVTIDSLGISKELLESGRYNAVRNKLNVMDRATYLEQMRRLAPTAEWGVGSAHAVTQNGELVFASFTGSQLAGYVFGVANMIWVVGAQKIVKDLDEAMERINQYVLPLENERAKKAYGSSGSAVNKILIIKKEINPKRATVFIVKEKLGF